MEFVKVNPITSMKNAFSVEGYNVVITGGNRGLGRGMAQAFAECGANVAILCRNEDSGKKAAAELSELGVQAFAVKCDVGNFDDILAAREAVAEKFDHIDVLINNAGIDGKKTVFNDERMEEFKRVMNVNLDGVAAMIQVFGQWMMDERRGGSIINISSIGGQAIGDPRAHPMPSYNASKAALDHLTRHLPPSITSFIDETMPMHRFGEPIEVGALAVFLASPAAAQITGVVANHDGGTMVVGLTF